MQYPPYSVKIVINFFKYIKWTEIYVMGWPSLQYCDTKDWYEQNDHYINKQNKNKEVAPSEL